MKSCGDGDGCGGRSEHGEEGLAACGSDALRWALIGYMQQGRVINLDVGRVVTARQFGNKLWQAARFTLTHLEAQNDAASSGLTAELPPLLTVEELLAAETGEARGLGQRWVLSRLASAAAGVDEGLEGFRMAAASGAAQRFVLDELCDEYIEMTKLALHSRQDNDDSGGGSRSSSLVGSGVEASAVLFAAVESSLRLLHPFLPFLTEELYQRLRHIAAQRAALLAADSAAHDQEGARSIMVSAFPAAEVYGKLRDDGAEADMETLLAVQTALRGLQTLRSRLVGKAATPSAEAAVAIAVEERDPATAALLREHSAAVLGRCGRKADAGLAMDVRLLPSGAVEEEGEQEGGWLSAAVGETAVVRLAVPLDDETQQKVGREVKRLEKKQRKLTQKSAKLGKQMGSARYQERASAEVRARDEATVAEAEAEVASIQGTLLALRRLSD